MTRWPALPAALCCAVIGGLSFALYAVLGLRIAEGAYFDHLNLLFDFDSGAYADLMTRPLSEMFEPAFGAIKHPLLTWLALVARPWLWLGVEPHAAVGLVAATAGALTVMLFWAAMRVASATLSEATLATGLFALGATQLFNGFLADSYTFASLTLAMVLLFGFRRIRMPGSVPIWFGISAVAAFGVTVTNVVQAAIIDGIGRLSARWAALRAGDRIGALTRIAVEQIRFGLVCGVAALALILVTWWGPLVDALADPIEALKQVYWTQTRGEITSAGTVLLQFFGYAFAAPHFSLVDLPEHVMRDFRHYAMPGVGAVALPLWVGFWVGLAALALRRASTRPYGLAVAACIAFNTLLHLDFQFRFSVFLYSGHIWVWIAAMAGIGMIAAREMSPRLGWACRAIAGLLLVLVAANNIPRAWEAATAFDSYPPFDRPPIETLPADGVTRPPGQY